MNNLEKRIERLKQRTDDNDDELKEVLSLCFLTAIDTIQRKKSRKP